MHARPNGLDFAERRAGAFQRWRLWSANPEPHAVFDWITRIVSEGGYLGIVLLMLGERCETRRYGR
jgi:hypothetical protein